MKTIYMKLLFLSGFFCLFLSCLPNKGIIRPHIILKLYDHQNKQPLENVKLIIRKDLKIDYTKISDKKGVIDIPKKEFYYGNSHSLALSDVNFIFEKENYISDSINYIKYFKLTNDSKRDKTYISDSIFLKRKN